MRAVKFSIGHNCRTSWLVKTFASLLFRVNIVVVLHDICFDLIRWNLFWWSSCDKDYTIYFTASLPQNLMIIRLQLNLRPANFVLICFDMHLPVLPICSPFFLGDISLSEFHLFCWEEDGWAIHNLPGNYQFCKILWENGFSAKRCIRGKYFPAENKRLVAIEFWAAIDCLRFVWKIVLFLKVAFL